MTRGRDFDLPITSRMQAETYGTRWLQNFNENELVTIKNSLLVCLANSPVRTCAPGHREELER